MPVNARQFAYLKAMGISVWELQTRDRTTAVTTESLASEGPSVASMQWDDLIFNVSQCKACVLHQTRTQTVFGVGNRHSPLLFIGEAPGADEDRQGEPFVGKAGQLLNEMLRAIGMQRQAIYIANVLKCRPPGNRDPKPEEAAACAGFLHRQIELIQPKLIVALGRIAAQRLLKTDSSLSHLRGRLHRHPETHLPLVVTYHPAYLLRSPAEKQKAWMDLLFIRQTLQSGS